MVFVSIGLVFVGILFLIATIAVLRIIMFFTRDETKDDH
jgi:hypothetical protein